MNDRLHNAIRILSDTHAATDDRILAAKDLTNDPTGVAADALMEVGKRPGEPSELLNAIGASLAQIAGEQPVAIEQEELNPIAADAFQRNISG